MLSPKHAQLLDDSGIDPAVRAERGYFTATDKAKLKALGFAAAQRRVPALVIPMQNLDGKPAGHQIRPDRPRKDGQGRALKYESPPGQEPVLDVPHRCRDSVKDPAQELWITEGSRKADAAASAGLACVSVQGVWAWRNEGVVLADLRRINLENRRVVIAFDSDAMRKREVGQALEALAEYLRSQGADPHYCYLPEGTGTAKVGLDDYLAGHTLAELQSCVVSERLRSVQINWTRYDYDKATSPPDHIVEGLLNRGERTLATADTKVAKSWVITDLGVAVLMGRKFLGREVRAEKIMVLSNEDAERLTLSRQRALGLRGDVWDRQRLACKQGVRLGDPAWNEELERAWDSFQPDIVFLETIMTATNLANVSDPTQVSEWMDWIGQMANTYQFGFWGNHHWRKFAANQHAGNADRSQAALGARQWIGQAETHIALAPRHQKKEAIEGKQRRERWITEAELELPDMRDGIGNDRPELITLTSKVRWDAKDLRHLDSAVLESGGLVERKDDHDTYLDAVRMVEQFKVGETVRSGKLAAEVIKPDSDDGCIPSDAQYVRALARAEKERWLVETDKSGFYTIVMHAEQAIPEPTI